MDSQRTTKPTHIEALGAVERTSRSRETVLIIGDDDPLSGDLTDALSTDFNLISVPALPPLSHQESFFAPDIIILNLAMAGHDAVETLADVRRVATGGDIPILVLFKDHSEEFQLEVLNAGAHDYLTIPFTPEQLRVRVKRLSVLARTQGHYRTLLNSMDYGYCTIEVLFDEHQRPVDYIFLEVNPAFEQQTGLHDAIGKRVSELVPAHEQHWLDIYVHTALTGEPARFEGAAGGLGRWYEAYAFRIGRAAEGKVAVFFNETTEKKRNEQALLENAQRLNIALSAGKLGDWHWNRATDQIALSPRAAEIFGLSVEKPITWSAIRERLHPQDREMARLAVEKALTNNVDYHAEYRAARGSKWIWVSAQGRAMHSNGCATGMIGVCQDITLQKEAEEALRRSEQELRALANSMPQLAWIAEPDGHITWYNQRWYEYTGTSLKEMRGWGWQAVHHPEHLSRILPVWHQALSSGKSWEDTFPLRGANGTYRWFLSRAYPVRDSKGNVTRWFGTNTDVEEVRRAQEALKEESRALNLLNKSGAAIASRLDLESLVQTVTDAGTELSGAKFGAFFYKKTGANGDVMLLYTLAGAPRSAFEKFGLPHSTPVFRPTFQNEGVVRSADITKDPRYGTLAPHHGMPKGHLPVCSYLAVPVVSRSGETIGGLFFGHPEPNVFSERSEQIIIGIAAQAAIAIDNARLYEASIQSQEALRKAHEELEQRVVERTAKLSEAVAQMEEFSYTVSHDLRAPLRGMRAYCKALLEECGEALAAAPHAMEYVQRVAENAARLDKMAVDVLTFSRVGQGDVHLEPVALDKLVRDIVEHYPAMRFPQAEIRIERLADVLGHGPSLTQVMSNLLANAIKFAVPNTVPTIRIWTEENDGNVCIWVEDAGIGIDPKYQHRLFRMFERIHPDGGHEGTGVGLAIVRKAASRMNGTVGVISDGKTGCRFWVQLRKP